MFKLSHTKHDLSSYATFPLKHLLRSVESTRTLCFLLVDVAVALLSTLARSAKLALVAVPTVAAFSVWAYIGYNSYILDVLS